MIKIVKKLLLYHFFLALANIRYPTARLILQPRFCKVDYRSVNVQCPNSTQDNTVLMMVLEAVMSGCSIRH